jgi:adenosylcobinamide amidohydrolase
MISGLDVHRCDDHVLVRFKGPRRVLSSAVLGGGWGQASGIVIMRVDENFEGERCEFDPPDVTLASYAESLDLDGPVVGMMTSAAMDSCRIVCREVDGVSIGVLVTAGLSNARCAGDAAEIRRIGSCRPQGGTINTVMATDAALEPAAMTECVMMATEAKAEALRRLGIRSDSSDRPATGTGTDSTCVVSGDGPPPVTYCGKHTVFGEVLANCVIEALVDSLGQ